MSRKLLFTIGLIVLIISTIGLLGCSTQPSVAQTSTPTVTGLPSTSPAQEMGTLTLPNVITSVKPSVVSINVEVTAYDFFNRPVKEEGAGSGWIIEEDGYIVTNNHVVENADSVTVTLDDGRVFQAESIKTDALTDLAIVKIDATGLPAASIGDSSKLQIGDSVVAIGNSLGQGISATAGIVSVVNVSLDTSSGQTLLGLIQTDAAINPGNSGGPLVNIVGEVIGINSLKVSQVGVEGMGYAISINEAVPVIETLIEKGYIVRPWLGIGITTVNDFVASVYNLSVNKGVLVANIIQDSPADKAGIEQGDIITAIDDKDISDTRELTEVISSSEVGQTVKVTYWRGDEERTTDVTLGESPTPEY